MVIIKLREDVKVEKDKSVGCVFNNEKDAQLFLRTMQKFMGRDKLDYTIGATSYGTDRDIKI